MLTSGRLPIATGPWKARAHPVIRGNGHDGPAGLRSTRPRLLHRPLQRCRLPHHGLTPSWDPAGTSGPWPNSSIALRILSGSRRSRPRWARMCRWIMRQREKTKKNDAQGEKGSQLRPDPARRDRRLASIHEHHLPGRTLLCRSARSGPGPRKDRPSRCLSHRQGRRSLSGRHPACLPLDPGSITRHPSRRRHLGSRPTTDLLHSSVKWVASIQAKTEGRAWCKERHGPPSHGQSGHGSRFRRDGLGARYHGGARNSSAPDSQNRNTARPETMNSGSTWAASTSASPTTAAAWNSTQSATT